MVYRPLSMSTPSPGSNSSGKFFTPTPVKNLSDSARSVPPAPYRNKFVPSRVTKSLVAVPDGQDGQDNIQHGVATGPQAGSSSERSTWEGGNHPPTQTDCPLPKTSGSSNSSDPHWYEEFLNPVPAGSSSQNSDSQEGQPTSCLRESLNSQECNQTMDASEGSVTITSLVGINELLPKRRRRDRFSVFISKPIERKRPNVSIGLARKQAENLKDELKHLFRNYKKHCIKDILDSLEILEEKSVKSYCKLKNLDVKGDMRAKDLKDEVIEEFESGITTIQFKIDQFQSALSKQRMELRSKHRTRGEAYCCNVCSLPS